MPFAGEQLGEHRCNFEPRHRRMRGGRPGQSSDGQQSRGRRMKALLNWTDGLARAGRACALGALSTDGSVAAEFALLAPIIILLAAAIADFGMLASKSVGL